MAEAFDPYSGWLGLPSGGGKPNHYQLFGLPEGESDPERIAIAADRAMAKVRSFRPGPNAAAWSRLLDEIHAAKSCLLEPKDKVEYDRALRSTVPSQKPGESKPSEPAAPLSQLPGREDFYPPGMGPPRGGSSAGKPADELSPPKPSPVSAPLNPAQRVSPAPLTDLSPPAPSTPTAKAVYPAPQADATMPVPAPYAPPQPATPQNPAMQPQPAYGGAPSAMPSAASPWGAPTAGSYPQQSYPQQAYPQQPYPQQHYPQQPYAHQPGMPVAYPQPGYPAAWPQQGYPGAMPQGMPMNPLAAPGYPAGMPMGMPLSGMAPMAAPMTPYDPLAGMAPPLAQPLSPYDPLGGMNPYGMPAPGNYPPVAPPPQMMPDPMAYGGMGDPSLDPMAPVAIPGMGGPGQPTDAAWGGSYGGSYGATPPSAQPASGIPLGSAMPASVAAGAQAGGAIPTGKAVPTGGKSPPETSPGAALPAKSAPQPVPGWNSSSSGLDGLPSRSEAQSQRNILIAGIGGGLALMILGFGYLIYAANQNSGPAVVEVDPESNSTVDPNAAPLGRTVESTTPPVVPVPIPQPPRPQPMPMPMPTPVPLPMPMPVEPKPMPMPAPMPAPPTPMPAPPTPMPMPTPPPLPVPTPPTPTPPTPTPPPMPQPVVAPTKDELIALGKACTSAKDALAEQNFDEAGKQIAMAESLAKLPEHKAKVARLKEVADYVKQFRAAVAAAVANFQAAETFKVGSSTQVAVVETFPDKIIIRSAGVNKTYPFADLPAGLAVAIADFKLDGSDPVSRVVKGAYLAVQKGDDSSKLDKAKTWWEEAQLGGAPVGDLMAFLTDKYDFENEAAGAK